MSILENNSNQSTPKFDYNNNVTKKSDLIIDLNSNLNNIFTNKSILKISECEYDNKSDKN
jgi:hypothetical protein